MTLKNGLCSGKGPANGVSAIPSQDYDAQEAEAQRTYDENLTCLIEEIGNVSYNALVHPLEQLVVWAFSDWRRLANALGLSRGTDLEEIKNRRQANMFRNNSKNELDESLCWVNEFKISQGRGSLNWKDILHALIDIERHDIIHRLGTHHVFEELREAAIADKTRGASGAYSLGSMPVRQNLAVRNLHPQPVESLCPSDMTTYSETSHHSLSPSTVAIDDTHGWHANLDQKIHESSRLLRLTSDPNLDFSPISNWGTVAGEPTAPAASIAQELLSTACSHALSPGSCANTIPARSPMLTQGHFSFSPDTSDGNINPMNSILTRMVDLSLSPSCQSQSPALGSNPMALLGDTAGQSQIFICTSDPKSLGQACHSREEAVLVRSRPFDDAIGSIPSSLDGRSKVYVSGNKSPIPPSLSVGIPDNRSWVYITYASDASAEALKLTKMIQDTRNYNICCDFLLMNIGEASWHDRIHSMFNQVDCIVPILSAEYVKIINSKDEVTDQKDANILQLYREYTSRTSFENSHNFIVRPVRLPDFEFRSLKFLPTCLRDSFQLWHEVDIFIRMLKVCCDRNKSDRT